MSDTQTTESAESKKRAAASNFLPIVRGRLPLIFVHAIRFDDVVSKMGTKDAAAKFGTSVGKVFDIHKNRNFSYIGADFMPTADDISAARAWAEQVGAQNVKGLQAGGDKALMLDIVAQYEARGLGSGAQRPARAPKEGGPKVSKESAAAVGAMASAGAADALLG